MYPSASIWNVSGRRRPRAPSADIMISSGSSSSSSSSIIIAVPDKRTRPLGRYLYPIDQNSLIFDLARILTDSQNSD